MKHARFSPRSTGWPLLFAGVVCAVSCGEQAKKVLPSAEAKTKTPVATAPVDPLALDPDVLKRCKDATVLIGNFEGGELRSTGSGFVGGDGKSIYTNRHVLTGSDEKLDACKLVFFSGSERARLVQVEPSQMTTSAPESGEEEIESDLAVIRLKVPVSSPLKLSGTSELSETSPAWALGFPRGQKIGLDDEDLPSPSVHALRVERLDKSKGKLRMIQLGGSPTNGNSGGPVVDSSGAVVGVLVAKDGGGAPIVFALPTNAVERLAKAKSSAKQVALNWAKPLKVASEPSSARKKVRTPFASTGSILASIEVSEALLSEFTPRELTLLRNEPYARRGYRFKRPEIDAHFRSLPWYYPATSDMEAVQASLSAREQRNVNRIREFQEATGKTW